MPTPALLLIIATLLPLGSFVLLVFLGKRLGNPLAGWLATAAIGAGFVCSMMALMSWLNAGDATAAGDWGYGRAPINMPMPWVPAGKVPGITQTRDGFLDLGVYVDSLTILMFSMVTAVSTLVHVFSIGYMSEDKRFPRFFTYLSLFCFSMLGLLLGGTLLQLFIFWELVGLCSYLLIGFWYEKKSASNAAIKAFVVNRVGDFGFLIGFGILFYHLGNASLPQVWSMLDIGKMLTSGTGGITLPGGVIFSQGLLTITGIGLFFGAVGKSAQFPLHVWLPDAMEGPTPVSALIHAATMVAAGVYLVGRIFPILTPDARLFIAVIGVTTLTMAALIALTQSDIKKVLAYSTLSQLGYMILAMGVGSWIGALFHLITHAFFKALLFLGSGSVIHAAHHEQEMSQYGGLMRKIPITAATFFIAVLAIAGTPLFSGYYSKDMILTHAGAYVLSATHGSAFIKLLFILPTLIAYVTAFYMMRCWMLTFWGKPRNQHLYDHARESPLLYVPLLFLAVLSIFGGKYLMVRELIENAQVEGTALVSEINKIGKDTGYNLYSQAWPAEPPEEKHGAAESAEEPAKAHAPTASQQAHLGGFLWVEHYVWWAFLVGIGLGALMYSRGYAVANTLMKITPLRWIHTWLYRRMYFDELYMGVFVAITMAISRFGAAFDKYVIDGVVNLLATLSRRLADVAGANDRFVVDGAVTGVAVATQGVGRAVRATQTGRIRLYVTALLAILALGIVAVVTIAVFMRK